VISFGSKIGNSRNIAISPPILHEKPFLVDLHKSIRVSPVIALLGLVTI
jgi:hypothetical protein